MKSKINVAHTAKLANLTLSSDELIKFEEQLSGILVYVDKLSELNTEGIPETSQVTGLENVQRDDVARTSLTQSQALSNAPKTHKNYFAVKGLLENND